MAANNLSDTLAGLLNLNSLDLADITPSDLLMDAPLVAALAAVPASQGGTTHKHLKETGAPTAQFRALNTGILNTASEDTLVTVECKFLDGTFYRDVQLGRAYKGGPAAYMARETVRAIRSMMVALERNILRGDAGVTGTGFVGFPDNTLVNQTGDAMVVNAGGDGGRSCWLLRSAPDEVAIVAGNDGALNFQFDPDQVQLVQTVANATLSNQRVYAAYVALLDGWFGMQYGSIYGLARICNLSGAEGSTLNDDLIAQAIAKFPSNRPPTHIVMDRVLRQQLQQSRTAYNPTGSPAPFPNEAFGIPIVATDQLKTNESTVTA
jgi:hypothetical protein